MSKSLKCRTRLLHLRLAALCLSLFIISCISEKHAVGFGNFVHMLAFFSLVFCKKKMQY